MARAFPSRRGSRRCGWPSSPSAAPPVAAVVDAPVLDLWRDDVSATPTADKVALALELEAATRAADPRVRGVESASYGDAAIEAAVVNSLGLEAATRRTVCSCSA